MDLAAVVNMPIRSHGSRRVGRKDDKPGSKENPQSFLESLVLREEVRCDECTCKVEMHHWPIQHEGRMYVFCYEHKSVRP